MKKKLQPFPRLNIFIHTNGATYNDSLYPINIYMWKPFISKPSASVAKNTTNIIESQFNQISSSSKLIFFLKNKHKKKLESFFNNLENNLNGGDEKNFLISSRANKQQELSASGSASGRIEDIEKTISCVETQIWLKYTIYQMFFKQRTDFNKMFKKLFPVDTLTKDWQAFSTLCTARAKTLDIDTYSNPFWNGNKDSHFGTFEQVSDSPLSKFKKRYGKN